MLTSRSVVGVADGERVVATGRRGACRGRPRRRRRRSRWSPGPSSSSASRARADRARRRLSGSLTIRPSLRRARDVEEGGLERVDVGGDDEVRPGEPAAARRRPAGRARRAGRAARSAAGGAAARPPGRPACPERQHVEGDVDDRDLGLDRRRRRLAPEPALERDERQDGPVAPAEDLAVEDAVPGERPRPPRRSPGSRC